MKVATSTWIWLAAAVGSIALVHGGSGGSDDAGGFVSTKSAARRLFSALPELASTDVAIEIAPSGGPRVRLRPDGSGHVVEVDGTSIGPADPEAVDGLLDSLRLATTLRAVPDDVDLGGVRRGTITVVGGAGEVSIDVRGETPDRAGLYGILVDGQDTSRWVIEREVAMILDQEPSAWLARRAVVVEPGMVTEIRRQGGVLRRGADGLWRSTVGDTTALLSTEGVESRLSRLVTARLDPMQQAAADAQPESWVSLTAQTGERWELAIAGPCPGAVQRVVLDRGPGWTGCIDAALTEPWPLVGMEHPDAGALIEPRLVPYGYGRVQAIVDRGDEPRALRRRVGDWVIETSQGGVTSVTEVDGAAVFDWYGRLHDAEVSVAAPMATEPEVAVDLDIETDTTVTLRLSCAQPGPDGVLLCRRDGGPWLEVRDSVPPLSLSASTFADRRLLRFAIEDVRALEILPADEASVRQSVHFDLGVWRLDAPTHPDGDDALSEPALEDVLGALGSARAEAWLDEAPGSVLRELRVERTPKRGEKAEIELRLHEDCVVSLEDRIARVDASTCEMLGRDLLHPDALDYWLRTARSLELTQGDSTARLRRQGDVLQATDGAKPVWVSERLQELAERRATSLGTGTVAGAAVGTLRVLPAQGPAFVVEFGENWARIEDAGWHYRY